MPGRVYTQLLEIAHESYGYLTPGTVRAAGIDPLRLQDLARRDLADHVAHGVYRLRLVPPTALDQYMEATLWSQRTDGVLSHETALDLHELCDVNPAQIHITVPAGYRTHRNVPALYVLHHRNLDPADATLHEGIRIVTPYRAILDGIDARLGRRLLDHAIDSAAARGLLDQSQLASMKGATRQGRQRSTS